MARARNIKPGFFSNDSLGELPPLARLLFAGLWTVCDRAGRVEDRPKKIKAEVLPYDACDADELLSMLALAGFIQRYEASGVRLIQVLTWDKHQNPHIKEGPSLLPAPDKHGASTVQAPYKHAPLPALAGLIPDSGFPSSVAKATGGTPPVDKSGDETKRELFDAGKSLLAEQGMPAKQTGSFIGKLAKDYGQAHALEAVRSAVVARPMGAAEYLKATCLRLAGERKDPVTVQSDEAARTAAYLAQQSARVHDPPPDIGERLRAAKQAVSVGNGSLRVVA